MDRVESDGSSRVTYCMHASVQQENEQPDYALEAENDYDFEELLSVNCAHLTGLLVYKTDA
jgi:hypothetical protein